MGSTTTKVITTKKPKIGGASKKGRQHSHQVGKYEKQRHRTEKHKQLSWKKHLLKHPNDLQNIKDIEKNRDTAG